MKPINNNWLTGITDAEGNFYFTIYDPNKNTSNSSLDSNDKSETISRRKKEVIFRFSITQENSERDFLSDLVTFFKCGNVHIDNKGGGVFTVNNKKDLITKIIPFFESNELQTIKKYSFERSALKKKSLKYLH